MLVRISRRLQLGPLPGPWPGVATFLSCVGLSQELLSSQPDGAFGVSACPEPALPVALLSLVQLSPLTQPAPVSHDTWVNCDPGDGGITDSGEGGSRQRGNKFSRRGRESHCQRGVSSERQRAVSMMEEVKLPAAREAERLLPVCCVGATRVGEGPQSLREGHRSPAWGCLTARGRWGRLH